MNFLAHLHLAGDSHSLLVGNFIGDFVKGKLKNQYSEDIMLGISLHRNIDHFTDNHPIARQSKIRLRKRYRHYSGVLVDMFYDHMLAVHWEKYAETNLEEFSQNVYSLLSSHIHLFPEEAKSMFPHMMKNNWLVNYREIKGIESALKGMARRTKFKSGLETGSEELVLYYSHFAEEFNEFFPQLIQFVEEHKNRIYHRL